MIKVMINLLILLLPAIFLCVILGPFWGTIVIIFILWLNYYSGYDN